MHAKSMKKNAKCITCPQECFTEYDQAASRRLENFFSPTYRSRQAVP